MYDGSTASARSGADGPPPHQRRKAVLSGGLHPQYADVVRDAGAAWRATRSSRLPPDVQRERGHRSRRSTTRHELRRRADARLLRQSARSHADRRGGACQRRAADRGLHRSRVARRSAAARRDGRRHRRSAKASRSAMRSISAGPMSACSRRAHKYVRQMPGRLVRRDGRRGRPARLRADACRPASSTSAARRRRATSAPIRASARSPSRSI